MFAHYYFAEQVQRYRRSPHKPRIDHVARSLVGQRYQDKVVADHLREWLRFTTDFDTRGIALPAGVLAPEAQEYLKRRLPHGSASRRRFIRASVRIFLETDAQGVFRRRIATAVTPPLKAWIAPAVDSYTTFLHEHRGLAARTVRKRIWQLAKIAEFLDHAGVTALSEIEAPKIHQFFTQLQGQKPATRLTYGVTLRSFLRWTYQEGLLPIDLSAAALSARHVRQAHVRDVLATEDMDRLLAAVDRSCAIGRRDYALLLLAIEYGLRPSDIRQLRLDDIRWRQELITIQQAKTGQPLTLPLLPHIAEALVAYLQDGRPTSAAREVFVRHRAPFEPFAPNNNLAAIMRNALRRVGLDQRSGRRGLYLFRHSLASRLLAAGCALKTIGDLLGHLSTDTTMEYANVDLTALCRVAISETEVCS